MTINNNHAQPSDGTNSEIDRYDLIQWRRDQILKLRAKGYSIDAIVATLKAGNPEVKISHGTGVNDLKAIKNEVNESLGNFIQNELPMENRLCLTGISEVITQAWQLVDSAKDERAKIAALSLVKDAYLTRQAVLGDTKVLEQAVQWVKRTREQLNLTKKANNNSTSGNSAGDQKEESQEIEGATTE